MCRHSHNGAGAISHQDVIRDPNGCLFTIDRVYRKPSGEDSGFFLVNRFTVDIRLAGGLDLVCIHLSLMLRSGDFIHQRMLR